MAVTVDLEQSYTDQVIVAWLMSGDDHDPFTWLSTLLHRPSWMAEGACRGTDPDVFFPTRGTNPGSLARARSVCAGCPVQGECLAHALASDPDPIGIWGGTSQRKRVRMRRQA